MPMTPRTTHQNFARYEAVLQTATIAKAADPPYR